MTREERRKCIREISDAMYGSFTDLVSNMHDLEELGCRKEAKKLDTIVGKLENLCRALDEK